MGNIMRYYTRLHIGVVYSGFGFMREIDLYLFSIVVDRSGNPDLYYYSNGSESYSLTLDLERNRVSELCRVKLWEI